MKVTRDAVLAAMAKCDEVGADAFLAAHGYGKPSSYVLRHGGRTYPSKAILGVAAGLAARDFSGGAAHVGCTLARLGFQVRGVGRVMAAMFLAASALGYAGVREVELNDGPVASFASGANHAGEIAGFAKIGRDVGVAANEVNAEAEAALLRLAGTDVQVFLDSGAFSEVAPAADGSLAVVAPIGDGEWRDRLALARRLAVVLGSQLHVVAPDRVGSQPETLQRLARYRAEVLELRDLGARVLVAMQRGDLSREGFAAEVDGVLGAGWWVPAIPMKKAPASPQEIEAFVRARQPRNLHLLGLGTANKSAGAVFAAIRRAAPDCLFTTDANLLRANVGRTNGPGGGPRRFTAALDTLATMFERFRGWPTAMRKKAAVVLCFGWGAWERQGGAAAPERQLVLWNAAT